MVYLDHRRFLPNDDPLRKLKAGFPSGKKQLKAPPPYKDMSFIDGASSRLTDTSMSKKTVLRNTGFKGEYTLRKLNHHDKFLNTPVEPMHLIKNLVEHIVRLISGAEDSFKVRNEEKARGRFTSAWVTSKVKSSRLPSAPFRLTPQQATLADTRLMSIQVPKGFGLKPKQLFTGKFTGMKSHSWKQLVATNILKYCIRGTLGQQQRRTLFFFCDVLAQLCADSVNMSLLEQLEYDVHHSLSLIERDFPVSLNVIVFHLLHHLPFYLRRFGPARVFWMYPYERMNSWVIRRVHNRRYPEATVVETYRIFEWASFLQRSCELPSDAITTPETDCESAGDRMISSPSLLSTVEFANLQSLYTTNSLRSELKREVKKMSNYTYTDAHSRTVTLTSASSDTRYTVSSYVFIKLEQTRIVGRISFFFQHSLSDDVYAYVHWFSNPKKEPESELFYIYLHSFSSVNPVTLVSTLSHPIVTATDIDDSNRLWILSLF